MNEHGRPLKVAMREIEDLRERDEMRKLVKQQRVAQLMAELQSFNQAGNQQGAAEISGQIIQELIAGEDPGAYLPGTEKQMKRNALVNRSYEMVAIYIEHRRDIPFSDFSVQAKELYPEVAVIWDFESLMDGFVSIADHPPDEEYPQGVIEIEHAATGMDTLTGEVAVAFRRYLHYLGFFAVEAAKIPCQACLGKPIGTCDECGSLGWVLKEDL